MESPVMVKAWEAPHLLSKFVKQMKDWSEDERYALGEKLENIKECAHQLVELQQCGEVQVLLRQVELFCCCARLNLQNGSPKEIPEEHFILKGVCGPQQLRDTFQSFKDRWLALKYTSNRLGFLTEDLKAAMDTICEFEDVWGCHYLLEEAMADCRSVFEDVYYLSLGLLTHSDLL
jgi:hypothetical protein